MGHNSQTLCKWKTPALVQRDKTLRARKAMRSVHGMSQEEVRVHISVFVISGGSSLLFNICVGIWYIHRYRKVNEELKRIESILDSRKGEVDELPSGKGQVDKLPSGKGQLDELPSGKDHVDTAGSLVQVVDIAAQVAQQIYNTDQ